jgi:hypothetical protein
VHIVRTLQVVEHYEAVLPAIFETLNAEGISADTLHRTCYALDAFCEHLGQTAGSLHACGPPISV